MYADVGQIAESVDRLTHDSGLQVAGAPKAGPRLDEQFGGREDLMTDMHQQGGRGESAMNAGVAEPCQIYVRIVDVSFGDWARARAMLARAAGLPLFDLSADSVVTSFDECADRLRMREREDELRLSSPAHGLALGHPTRHPQLSNLLGLADSTKPLAKQGFHSLDPGTIIRRGDLLDETSCRTRGNCRSPTDSLVVLFASAASRTTRRMG